MSFILHSVPNFQSNGRFCVRGDCMTRQHGKGKYILPDGVVKVGLWEDGKRSKWLEGEEIEGDPEGGANRVGDKTDQK